MIAVVRTRLRKMHEFAGFAEFKFALKKSRSLYVDEP